MTGDIHAHGLPGSGNAQRRGNVAVVFIAGYGMRFCAVRQSVSPRGLRASGRRQVRFRGEGVGIELVVRQRALRREVALGRIDHRRRAAGIDLVSKRAVDAFASAWENPRKTQERKLLEVQADDTSKRFTKSLQWWRVACEDGLHHIEQLHVVLQDVKTPRPWPETREGFKALYLAMFAELSGSVVLEPVADIVEWNSTGKDGHQKLGCSPENLEGMLDAIAERTTARRGMPLSALNSGAPLLSVVMILPENAARQALIDTARNRNMLKEDKPQMRENGEAGSATASPLSTATIQVTTQSSLRNKIFASSVEEEEESEEEV